MKKYYERLKEEAPKIENIYSVAFGENADLAQTLVKGLITKSKGEQETREIAWTIMARMKSGLEEYTEVMEEEDGADWEATLFRGQVEYADVERWGIFKSICCKYDGACDQIEETLKLMAIKSGYLQLASAEEFDEDNEVDGADEEWESLLGSLLAAA